MNENELITSVLNGNTNAFGPLVTRYQELVFNTCMGFVHNADEANDLTQDVFIRAFEKLSQFNHQASFSTWLYRIAINTSLNAVRSKKSQLFQRMGSWFETENKAGFEMPSDQNLTPESLMLTTEQSALVQKELDKLSEKQRVAFVLSRCENLPQKEIASIMQISEGAVESLIKRAKTNLAKNISSYFKK
ncbi:MAG: RNA polymerase sigma factor [Bacteroidetes bacterium HGW-Bacteroidetes-4]|jgi:RNA polymerase sigma-70 factor (ECF subfamily)|nr:MAG: RNA polymerase sigma factor [Bacteroidetes bacterium HGW-Bacteroidetes-4]